MMFDLVSDVHLDHSLEGLQNILAAAVSDTLVISGDWCEMRSELWASSLKAVCGRYRNVIYVLGNHEHYWSTFVDPGIPNLHILDNSSVVIGGVKFAGTTLWFPESWKTNMYKRSLNDYRCISNFQPGLWHSKAQRFLAETEADVFITHHAPSNLSIHPSFADNPLNCFYVGPAKVKGKVWVHGHMHRPVDYNIGSTRVVSNPFGYPQENGTVIPKQIKL